MITLCHAAKGGSGTTVVACGRAVGGHGPALLVDLEGEAALVLGLDESDRPGVLDWLTSEAPADHLDDLLIEVTPSCHLIVARSPGSFVGSRALPVVADERWEQLALWLLRWAHDAGGSVVVDAGTSPIPPSFAERCPTRWLVTRACYLSLRRAAHLSFRPTGVVLVDEPGRGLAVRDIESSVGAPVIVSIPWDLRIARSVDSGLLLAGRLPRLLNRHLSKVAA